MPTKGKVKGIIANLVIVEADGPVAQNEICMIGMDGTELMAEVIKIQNNRAFVQVFESTRGLKVGTEVDFTGSMLEVTLGPGILSRNYDGLQNDLDRLEGVFLKKGERNFPLDENAEWKYKPLALKGEEVVAGSWLGEVTENWMPHKIMVPFKFSGTYTIKWMAPSGDYKINEVIAILADSKGNEHKVTMVQKWPVKLPVKAYRNKVRPFRIMETGIRVIDTLNPMTEGGTGFIPGPFGCGKTVLQHALSRQAEADMVVIAACGERANEVVEIFTEFPELIDARTGRKLIERTTIIANTSSMPVAAREASVYTAMTIAEYYRSMGLKILLLADSTSRWAQALREMSNRMEELPGPDAFPMDLPAIISNYYSRAGYVILNNGNSGSITFIGTVSPAGGNLKEPVTESTKKTARCFYALSQQRSDSKRYPAIDPIDSYSKYLEYDEVKEYISANISPDWVDDVIKTRDVLLKGREAQEQINILGDDGVPVDYHVRFWKSEVVDFIVLQQDGFDVVDRLTPIARQKFMLDKILGVIDTEMKFESFDQVASWFKKLINLFKQMNYSSFKSDEFNNYLKEIDQMLTEISGR
ncbi:MAG: V-type ATP synthase subunit A [Bacteroidales bacterium]|nr:V-type ATP synthase subunit A [Bacteroidales bacterium]MBN2634446.1 V-type ATP synthase subunit A [Bacteroidales bacterium]